MVDGWQEQQQLGQKSSFLVVKEVTSDPLLPLSEMAQIKSKYWIKIQHCLPPFFPTTIPIIIRGGFLPN